jgi:uncharacterized membrane protein YtjA (UPF0391 family)
MCRKICPEHRRRSDHLLTNFPKEITMLRWALIFLVVALLAGVFGFWGLEGTAMWMARVLFFLFLILFIVSLIFGGRATRDVV